jgi:hypothetical protein
MRLGFALVGTEPSRGLVDDEPDVTLQIWRLVLPALPPR